ncbi:MAG: hypothetical protein ACHQKY_02475 [Terriglobia bacterium]
MRIRTVLLSVLVSMFWSSSIIQGCLCGNITVCEAYAGAPAVFVGKVVSRSFEASSPGRTTELKDGRIYAQLPSGFYYRTRIAVEKVFRGNVGPEVEFTDVLNDCSVSFEVNKRYLIFAATEQSKQSAPTRCTRTRLAADAKADLEYFSALQRGEEEGHVQGYIRRYGDAKSENSAGQEQRLEGILVVAEGNGSHHEATPQTNGVFAIALPRGEYRFWLERNSEIVSRSMTLVKVGNKQCSRTELAF